MNPSVLSSAFVHIVCLLYFYSVTILLFIEIYSLWIYVLTFSNFGFNHLCFFTFDSFLSLINCCVVVVIVVVVVVPNELQSRVH